jgi:hypothetical protein
MQRPNPDPTEVAREAKAAGPRLDQWLDQLQDAAHPVGGKSVALDADRVQGLLLRLARRAHEGEAPDWDEAMQTYLAVAALYQTRAERDPAYALPRRRDALGRLRETLAFPADRQRGFAFDSPRDFTPAHVLGALKGIQSAFGD